MSNFLLFSGFFQEDHYDRPPATRIHMQSEFDANTEHVYDEIPLQSSPSSSRRNVWSKQARNELDSVRKKTSS